MDFEKIPISNVKSEIEKIFLISSPEEWNLVPGDIDWLARTVGIELQWQPIEWWTSFEYGQSDITANKFFSTLFERIKPANGKVLIVTDECFKEKISYCINYIDLIEFSQSVYPSIHQMDFFQPLDYVFVFPDEKLLVMLHHEGNVLQFRQE